MNFQIHKSLTLDLQDGMVALVGQSSSGKTAVLRAIRFCLYNQMPGNSVAAMISHGETHCEVEITFDDGLKVLRVRDSKTKDNYYIVTTQDGEVRLDTPGTGPVKDVVSAHGMRLVSFLTNKDSLNYASQHDAPFFINASPQERMKAVGILSNTEVTDAGIKIAAIADHNSVKAVEEAVREGEKNAITVIPAIEIDCIYEGVNLHLLGYYIDPKFQRFYELEEDILRQEQTASPKRVELIQKAGIYVNLDKIKNLSKDGVITGEMIAESSLYEPENKDNDLLKPYLSGGSRSDNPYVNFYWDFCAQGKIAYAHVNYISLEEAISIIIQSGGIPILAHPGKNVHEDKKLLSGIMSQGVKGMEVYSSYHTPEQILFYRKDN